MCLLVNRASRLSEQSERAGGVVWWRHCLERHVSCVTAVPEKLGDDVGLAQAASADFSVRQFFLAKLMSDSSNI